MTPNRNWLLGGGFLCASLFVASLMFFGSLEPGYSNATKAVSELGALGVRVGPWFDFFGLLLPGLLVTGVAWEFRRSLLTPYIYGHDRPDLHTRRHGISRDCLAGMDTAAPAMSRSTTTICSAVVVAECAAGPAKTPPVSSWSSRAAGIHPVALRAH